ncbi:MAG: ABC transporter substrate-binding protein, partial [Anaerolineae bacterium]|nr:ABC transporter substrate-binding protein [Anaerolineae bacterium]
KSEITVEEIGFTQAAAVSENQVDAAMVYIANEPIQLTQAGQEVNVIEVSDFIDLVSNGLVTNQKTIDENPELVGRMVRALLKGVAYTIDHPDEAFDLSREFIPDMTDEDAPTQKLVLDASIDLWRSENPGVSSVQAWQDSADFMLKTGLIEEAVEVEKLFTNQFVGNEP